MENLKKNKKESSFSKLFSAHRQKINYIITFFFIVFVYGFLINYSLYMIFNLTFSFGKLVAWGVLAYFIKVEIPAIISSSLPKKIINLE